ncbi:MAG: hypothetical protein H7Y04_00065, partial [Verrucomicrobia bacterium]|nr:hypothetical protein [Cytophagales bacterium]
MTRLYNIFAVVIGLVFLYAAYEGNRRFSALFLQVHVFDTIAAIGVWKILLSAFFYL